MSRVWIIEMKTDGKWQPTVGICLTKEDTVEELKNWHDNNPDDKFRVRIYERRYAS